MIELPLVFVAGVLGTAHCLGMCGPLALVVGGAAGGWLTVLGRQLAYTAGRIFTYSVLGAAAGYLGVRLSSAAAPLVNVPAILAIAAGLLLVGQGLHAAGWGPETLLNWLGLWPKRPSPAATCLAGGLFGHFLRRPGVGGALLAGMFTGLLPCGLLYGMLALASTTHSVVWGAATMTVFGLGTAPAMIVAGLGGRIVSLAFRRRLYQAAAWCLVLTGVLSLARGAAHLSLPGRPVGGCPMCVR